MQLSWFDIEKKATVLSTLLGAISETLFKTTFSPGFLKFDVSQSISTRPLKVTKRFWWNQGGGWGYGFACAHLLSWIVCHRSLGG